MFKENYKIIYDQITPEESLISDALARERLSKSSERKRVNYSIVIPACVVASLLVAFILMVNLSSAVVQALAQVPLLRELTAVVSFSPSLTSAVENDYVQYIGLEDSNEGITIKVEHVIVDHDQLHVFYSLSSEKYENMRISEVALYDTNGLLLDGYTMHFSSTPQSFLDSESQQDDLQHLFLIFHDTKIPNDLIFKCSVFDIFKSEWDFIFSSEFSTSSRPIPISTFEIPLSFDTDIIPQTENIQINHEFTIDGQNIVISSVDISLTHTRLNIIEDTGNTAWLRSLSSYLIDENGTIFELMGYCYDNMELNRDTLHYESTYFADNQNLTLVIADAFWLDKNAENYKVSLINRTVSNLPSDIELIHIGKEKNDYALTFSAPNREQRFNDPYFINMGRQMYNLFEIEYLDESGNIFVDFQRASWIAGHYEIWDSSTAWEEIYGPEEFERMYESEKASHLELYGVWNGYPVFYKQVETPGRFGQMLFISDYPYDTLYLRPYFTHINVFETPIEVIIK
ncbi:MAG: DUF4179 domain-containing protein [Oscillospiraceae bacterium]|jgi:hypothetical protein|nr:DUF4179 domain-containing protein [Oscillospiraceae bacterium]